MVVTLALVSGLVVNLPGRATSPEPGSRARGLEGGMGGGTDFPHSCLPTRPALSRPTSFSLCFMTLFVFKCPRLRKPQRGVTGLG